MFDATVARLVDLAYTRVDMVGKRGEFAVRGGILDVFPPTAEHPVRVEFWGDEVSEMRMFSVADQRSIPEIDIATVIAVPCRELLLTADVRDRAQAIAAEHPVLENSVPGSVPDMLAKLSEGIPVDGMEALLPLLRPADLVTLPSHLPAGHAAADLRPGEGPHPGRRPDQDRPRVPRGVLVGGRGRRGRPDRPRGARRVGVRRLRRRPRRRARRRPSVVDAEPAHRRGRPGPRHPAGAVGAGPAAQISTRSSRCCAPTSPPAGYGVVVTPGTGTGMRVVEQLGEADTPATMLEPGAARAKAWSACSRARCTTAW